MSDVAAPTLDAPTAAAELHEARHARRPRPMLTGRWPGMTTDDAYAVQAAGIGLRLGEGETIVGGKLGFTSAAMREAMGVDEPNYGWLTDAMVLPDGIVDLDRFLHPKVEPEIAFVLGRTLEPPVTVADVLRATTHVAPCLEVVDSRYEGFRFRAFDNIADDSSAGAFVLGDPVPLAGIDLRTVGVLLTVDGALTRTAAGAAVHGHPAAAVAWMADRCDRPLEAGHVVLSGGLTAPADLRPGTVVTADIDRIGSVTVVASRGDH